MKISDLRPADFQKYFEVRLANNRLRRSGSGYMAMCPFHSDRNPSLSVSMEKGVWKCHSGCGDGGLIAFEQMLDRSCDPGTAIARIAEIVGAPQLKIGGSGPEAVYTYVDATGKPLFEVVRFPGKKFLQRRRDERGGWVYKTSDMKMVPYHLNEILTAKEVFCVEGEKDADNLRAAILEKGIHEVAVTTSPRGAGKWQETFAPYFAGRKVAVLPDQDEPGIKHAKHVANSVYRYAHGVKIVNLPDVKDVSEFLQLGHTVDEVARIIQETSQWHPDGGSGLLADYATFEGDTPDAVDWIIEGLAERGSNSMIVAPPKSAKSYVMLYMAMCLATGHRFFDFRIERRVKTAYFSREDNPATTGHRARRVRLGMGFHTQELSDYLYFNTRRQSAQLMLDNAEEVNEAIAILRRLEIEVAIFDVMRILHASDENDNTQMQIIINSLNRIRDEAGVTVMLVHHSKKGSESASLTEQARGAGAIAGWAETLMGVREIDTDLHVRKFEVEMKGAEPPKAFQWKINDYPSDEPGGYPYVKLELIPFAEQIDETKKRAKGKKFDSHDGD